MPLLTMFDDLPVLVLIEIFSYLWSFVILWELSCLNQRVTLLLVERRYFRYVNLSSASCYQFNRVDQVLVLNEIESVIIDVNASSFQWSYWTYLSCLKTLWLKGIREYNDVIIFLLLHAATLTHLTVDTRRKFISVSIIDSQLFQRYERK